MGDSLTRRSFLGGAALAASGAFLLGMSGCKPTTDGGAPKADAATSGAYRPGTYTAEGKGIGTVTVEMTFAEDEITRVAIDASHETPELGGSAAPQLEQAILEAQSSEVDTVSGATITSKAVREAAASCIAQAKGQDALGVVDDGISPIAPASVPPAWDYEADAVIVGASGAGLVAAARLAQNGKSVIVVEMEGDVGGTGRVTQCICNYGGNAFWEGDDGVFGSPYRDQDVVDVYQERSRWTVDEDLLKYNVIALRETFDWWHENEFPIIRMGEMWGQWWFGYSVEADTYGPEEDKEDMKKAGNVCTRPLLYHMRDIALDNGAKLLLSTQVNRLVMDGDACVGAEATTQDGSTVYLRGTEAVILAADGISGNRKMLEAYGGLAAQCKVTFNNASGQVVRMGLGVGGDMAGIGSFATSSLFPVPPTSPDGDSDYMLPAVYYNDGMRALAAAPWLRFDKRGNRRMIIDATKVGKVSTNYDMLESWHREGANQYAHGDSFVLFDGNYRQSMETLKVTKINRPASFYHPAEFGFGIDFDDAFASSLEKGTIKRADTLGEIAKAIGMDAELLQGVVDEWNEQCDSGEPDTLYNYNVDQLIALRTPPYYCMQVCHAPYSTFAGLRVSPKNEVLTADGHAVPGLYAAFHTAGGLAGEYNPTCPMGDQIGSMFASGYNISKAILGEEWLEI